MRRPHDSNDESTRAARDRSIQEEGDMTLSHAEPDTRPDTMHARLVELGHALERETEIVDELRGVLIRQRQAVATTQADAVNVTVDAIGRILLTLEEARRRRATMTQSLTGDAATRLDRLEAALSMALPASVADSRRRLRESAASVAREVAINRDVLRRAVESGEAFLQALFSATGLATPVYGTGEKDESPSGMLLNRRA
jgi:hypothetical protein